MKKKRRLSISLEPLTFCLSEIVRVPLCLGCQTSPDSFKLHGSNSRSRVHSDNLFKTEPSHPVDPLAGGDRAADPDHAVGQERGG